jgi:cell division protein FtsA
MDGLRRQERKRVEKQKEALQKVAELKNKSADDVEVMNPPKKERKSFLDKLTERVKDFLDNAE